MSQITYHFGGKEGLYLAAARHIAKEFAGRIGGTGSAWSRPDERVADPAGELLGLLDRYTQVLLSPGSASWAPFIMREQMNPTQAFEILYSDAMGKVIDRASGLIAEISQGRCSRLEARIRTIAIIGQALVFRLGRSTVLRATSWGAVGDDEATAIRRIVRTHTSAILADLSAGKPRA
jgi:AcrR family transcriptional regulator